MSESSPRPWFRFYTEAIYDRKLRRLKPEHRWLWVVVLSLARRSPQPGALMLTEDQPIDLDDLVDAAAMSRKSIEQGMLALEGIGVIVVESGAWIVPQWGARQYESDVSTERVKRHRERRRNVSATPPETETETDNPPNPPRGGPEPVAAPWEACPTCEGSGVDPKTNDRCDCTRITGATA